MGKHCVKEDQTWITSCSAHPQSPIALDVMQSYLLEMWVRGDFGIFLQDSIRMKSHLAGDDGDIAFVTAYRGAASHHGKGWREQKSLSTGAYKIVAPLSGRPNRKRGRGVNAELSHVPPCSQSISHLPCRWWGACLSTLLGSSVSEASAGSQGNHGDLCASLSWDEIAQDGKRGYFKLDSFEGKSAYLKAFIFSSLVLKRSKRI